MRMQPDQQLPPAPPPMNHRGEAHAQYDFIMNPGQPQKKTLLPSGNSTKQRILVVAIAGAVLVTIIMVIFSLLANSGKGGTEDLITAAKQQTELIRVAGIGVSKARSTPVRNLAITTQLSLQSQKAPLLTAIKDQGGKVNEKDLALGKISATDTLLKDAEQSNRFDEVFFEKLQADLVAYQKTVKKAYDAASNKKAKQTLATQYRNASILAGVKEE